MAGSIHVKLLEEQFLLPLFEVIQYAVIFISSFLLMLYFDIIITICVVAATAVMFLVPAIFGTLLEKRQNLLSQEMSGLTSALKDILSGFEVVYSYSIQDHVRRRFDVKNRTAIKAKYSADRLTALNEGISAFLSLMIQVTGLGFSFDGKEKILQNFHYRFQKGKKYAITGKSGCGKSTLVRLLCGHYGGYEGQILYDGTELHALLPGDIARLSSVIHQNVCLFDGSIYENISLFETYPKALTDDVLRESGLSEFIASLPEGLGYQIEENGANLSGVQKQRIAIARALIRQRPILILDEGTSAIDRKTADDIERRLLKKKGLTLINITHHIQKELESFYDDIIEISSP